MADSRRTLILQGGEQVGMSDKLPAAWVTLSTRQRDILLATKINEPVTYPDLRVAVAGDADEIPDRTFERVLARLREKGLLEHKSRGGGPGNPATYTLTDAGRERVEAIQGLLWDVATAGY